MTHVYYFSMQKLLETTYQSKKHIFLTYVTGAFSQCILKKLNWFFALLMTIAYLEHFSKLYQNLKIILKFYSNRTLQAVILHFANCPFKRKKVWYDPLCFIAVSLSLCLSLSILLLCVSYTHTNALCIFHSILMHTYVHKQT